MAGTLGTMALQPATGVSVTGGTATSLTGLSVRSTGAATVSIQQAKVTSGTATVYIGSIFRIRKA